MLISEMRNPQLFQDLCQQLFMAEYEDFQHVDDSRGDEGCDGYSLVRRRLFAIYCPEKSPTPIEYYRRKIRGDLAKAARLLDQYNYQIEDWIFVTPAPLTEELHRFIRESAGAFGFTGLSWSDKQLVQLLAKHEKLQRQFPSLLVPDIKRELHTGFNRLSAELSEGLNEVTRTALSEGEIEIEVINLMIDRFLSVFNSHGILTNQIPQFVAPKFRLKLSDFKNRETVLNIMSHELIEWTCETFRVRREWIEGCFDWRNEHNDQIYPKFEGYKEVKRFIETATKLRRSIFYPAEMYVLKIGELNRREQGARDSQIAMVLREVIATVGQKQVHRYFPITTRWLWSYTNSRFQAKALFLICEKLSIEMHGYDLEGELFSKLAEGRVFPAPVLSGLGTYTWYPEDYIDLPKENVHAKETDEVESARQYIKNEGYLDYLNKVIDSPSDE